MSINKTGGFVLTPLAILALACGGGDGANNQASQAQAAPPAPAASTPAAATGTTHEVQMVLEGSNYKYIPESLTIKVGDVVRFLNVSGFPHNVVFWTDSIPAGAADVLSQSMPDQMAPLSGPLLTTGGQVYEVSFVGVPTGEYKYYCLPHLSLGMVASLTVED